jgi:hypothetical protein
MRSYKNLYRKGRKDKPQRTQRKKLNGSVQDDSHPIFFLNSVMWAT